MKRRRDRRKKEAVAPCPDCTCPEPAKGTTVWCQRHRRFKTTYTWRLCQHKEKYRRMLDSLIEHGAGDTEPPKLRRRVLRWAEAVARWTKAGQPVRKDSEVELIFSEICGKCRDFDEKRSRCRICGCRLGKGKGALLNKVRMATEDCPLGKWPTNQWTASEEAASE